MGGQRTSSSPPWTSLGDFIFTIWIHLVEFLLFLAWPVQSYPGLHWTDGSSLVQSGPL